MPVVKIFVPLQPSADAAEALASDLESLCAGILRARPDAIQVVVVQAAMPRGASVLAEVHYRAQAHRDAAALESFMDGVERAVRGRLGAVPRIRCFAVDQGGLSARH